jgi:hypothetical protein
MSDSPLSITASTVQFLGIRSLIEDIIKIIHFIRSSGEHNTDLAWFAGTLKWELESLDQWGIYAGLKVSDSNSQVSEHSILASCAVRKRVVGVLVDCRSTIEELKLLLRTDDLQAPHTEAPSGSIQTPGAASTSPPIPSPQHLSLIYTENIIDSEAVVAAAESHGLADQSSFSLNRVANCVSHNKERLEELLRRLTNSNRRLREELPNPDTFYRSLASALLRDLTPEELQQFQPSDTAFVRILTAHAHDKENSRLLQSTHVDGDFELKLTQSPIMDTDHPPDNRVRGLARRAVDGGRVLVEWKHVAQTSKPGFRAAVKKRLDNLARCLHPEENSQRSDFHMMSCDGWFEDDDINWLGIVYQVPPSVDHLQEPHSLADIIADPTFPIPSLGMRFKLANQFAISLQQYHAIQWFHKAFNSYNILFFFDPTSNELRLEEPYIVGFGSSRRNKVDATEGVDPHTDHLASLYQHPDIEQGFRAAYDVYGLGYIMLELACWKTLEAMEIQSGMRVSHAYKERWMKELQGMAADLGPVVGEIYQDAVGWCLCHAVVCRDDKEVMRGFVRDVERQLASLRV